MTLSPLGRYIGIPPTYHMSIPVARSRVRLVAAILRWPVVKSVAAVLVALALLPAFARLSSDITWTEAIPESSDTIQALRTLDRQFGGSLPVFIVLEWPDDTSLPSPALVAVVQDLHRLIERFPQLGLPHSFLSLLKAFPGGTIQPHESWPYPSHARIVVKSIRSIDSSRLVVSVLVPDRSAASLQPTWDELNRELREFDRRHPGFQTHLTGSLVVAGQNLRAIIDDLRTSLTLAAILVGILMMVVFRSLPIGIAALLPNSFPLLINASILAYSNLSMTITSVLTFSLCLGLAVDDTIHFIARFQRERRAGCSVRVAVRRSYFHVGGVLIATSAILLTGFGVLLLSDVPAVRLFAGLSCVALVSALLADLIVLPSMLLCLIRDSDHS